MSHVLVTNDFPPKVGGIQSYLWEMWRRLEPSSFRVVTISSAPGAEAFDEQQRARGVIVDRLDARMLLPTPRLAHTIAGAVNAAGASLVVLDPALPLGLVGRKLSVPYAVVLHGAEITVPARLPLSHAALASVLRGAKMLICAGGYPASEARRVLGGDSDIAQIPPGVDTERFHPLDESRRRHARDSLGVDPGSLVVLSVSRLVPRKGMDVLIEASSALASSFPRLVVLIAGDGRDRPRLERLARRHRAPVRFLGLVRDHVLPLLYGAADVFVLACRNRWGGLEQEGFGIVFLEAAACAVPEVAGMSGGAHEAVVDQETGFVISDPTNPALLAAALRRLLADEALRVRMGTAARRRAEDSFGYDLLSHRLGAALSSVGG